MPARRDRSGMSLVELMVALALGMLMSLAIVGVLTASQGQQRTSTSLNDLAQSGHYAMYALDRWLRSAGSGLVQAASDGFGCDLYAANSKAGAQILPRGSTALPAPFAPIDDLKPTGTAGLFRLAPVVIVPDGSAGPSGGRASDALIVMSGAAGFGEMAVPVLQTALPTATSIAMQNTLSFRAGDLVLITDQPVTPGKAGPCLVEMVDPAFVNPPSAGAAPPTTLPLGGQFYKASIGSLSVANTSMKARVTGLGNVVQSSLRNPPSFLLIGVGAGNVLYSYDLLQQSDVESHSASMPVADSVFEMRALYGVDTTGNGTLTWVSPSTAGYKPEDLVAGTTAARDTLLKIRALRIGLIMVSPLLEREKALQAPTLTLFADLGSTLTYTRTALTVEQSRQRYRTFEATIPLRNL